MFDKWKCERCGAYSDEAETWQNLGAWRWTGTAYEHKCSDAHPQAGHFSCVKVDKPRVVLVNC